MMKFMILFRPTTMPPDDFENAYNDFLALVERMPDIKRRQVIHITGSPRGKPPCERILEIYFDDQATLEAALRSDAGQEAGKELRRFPPEEFDVMFAQVFEEAGGSTTQPDTSSDASSQQPPDRAQH